MRTREAGACALVLSLGLVAPGAAFELQPVRHVPIAPLRPEEAPRPPEWMERFVPDPATGFGFHTRGPDSLSGIPVAEQAPPPGAAAGKAAAADATAGQATPFSVGQGYPLGGWCFSLAIARFRGNGQMDIAAAEYEQHAIRIFLNNGLANYTDFDTIVLDGPPYWVTAGDFNDDGNQDLAVAINTNPGRLEVLDGRGDGTFAPARSYAAGPWSDYVAAGDLDGDGLPDLVVSNYSPGSISVFINRGSAGFAAGVEYPTGAGAAGIGFADLDADGAVDVIVANAGCPTVTVWHNAGDGTLDLELLYPTGGRTLEVAAADYDGDGWTDVAVSTYDAFNVLWNDGAGGFASRDDHFVAYGDCYGMAAADLDRDGRSDLVMAFSPGSTDHGSILAWVRNTGRRAFAGGARYFFWPSYSVTIATALGLADVDGDGSEDLVAAARPSSYYPDPSLLWIMRRMRGPVFEGVQDYYLTPHDSYDWTRVAAVDFAGTGYSDVVASRGGRLLLMAAEGDGRLADPVDLGPGELAAASDLNGDGLTDVVLSAGGAFSVRLCQTDGTLAPGVPCPGRRMLGIADFDGDGTPDLLVRTADDSVRVLPNDGAGAFPDSIAVRPGLRSWCAIGCGDLDGDGRADLAVAWHPQSSVSADSLEVLHNDGAGAFHRVQGLEVADSGYPGWRFTPLGVLAADLDRDDSPDLVIYTDSSPGSAPTSVLLNQGDGTFGAEARYDRGTGEEAVVLLADFDRDGAPDMASVGHDGIGRGYLQVRMNQGDGTFDRPNSWDDFTTVEEYPGSLAAGDLDRDGMPELIIGYKGLYAYGGVCVLANTFPAGPTPALVSLVDARVVDGRALLTWFAAGTPPGVATVMRRDDATWSDRARLMADGTGRFTFEDRDVRPGARYAYRLRFGEGASAILTAEVEVAIPALSFVLEPPRPNPTAGDLVISFTLPVAAPARLELLDVSGRRVRAHAFDQPAPGRHTLDLARGSHLPAGIYWVRLTQGARSVAARAIVLR